MIETIHFENRDCVEAMKEFPDKFFDLAIVDPPYGIGEDGAKNKTRGSRFAPAKEYHPFFGNDKHPPDKEYFAELFRVSKNQVVFGANHFIERMPRNSHCWLVWDKQNDPTDFADAELAWTSFAGAVRIFRYKWNGMLQENMKDKETRIHPTQKPVALYKWILNRFAKDGMKILDTHVGSASSLIACNRMGFECWGYEIDETYYKLAQERIKRELAQGTLF